MSNMKVNVFNLSSLVLGKYYKMVLLIEGNQNGDLVLKIDNVGNAIILAPNAKQIKIKPGIHKYTVFFKANRKIGSLMLYPEIGS